MEVTAGRAAKITAIGMIVVALTQIAYVTIKGEIITAQLIWKIETVAFLAIAVFALVPRARRAQHNLGWAALSLFGLLNMMQAGIGLFMFGPLKEGGEPLAPVFGAVLAGAFFLYFAAKVMVGIAAIIFGLELMKGGQSASGGAAKAIGTVAALTGLAAFGVNLFALVQGMAVVEIAGAVGTAATIFCAAVLVMLPHPAED